MKLSFTSFKNRAKSYLLRYTNRMELFHQLDYPKHKLFLCENVRIASCRKEPDTVRWIETFKKSDVALDVGANVGAYSLIMALYAKQVYAFEPAVTNYRLLCKNILTNVSKRAVENNITPFNIALSDETKMDLLNYVNTHEGKSGHQIKGRTTDCFGKEFQPAYQHQMMCYKLDDWLETFALEVPQHIKIDVDGNEYAILLGAEKTLGNRAVKTLLVEINDDLAEREEILGFLERKKFHPSDKFCASPGHNIYNYLFER